MIAVEVRDLGRVAAAVLVTDYVDALFIGARTDACHRRPDARLAVAGVCAVIIALALTTGGADVVCAVAEVGTSVKHQREAILD